jgi:hypothetical protein
MSLSVPRDWIVNHMRVASKLAMTVEAVALQQRLTVPEILATAGEEQWKCFAHLACASDDPEYIPSSETRVMVAELIRDDQQVLCVECGLTQATRRDQHIAQDGDEFCLRCWKAAYVLSDSPPPAEPLPANVTPLRRVQHVEKRGPWATRDQASTTTKTKE